MCCILQISYECISAVATVATAAVAWIALIYTMIEYHSHKEREQATTLAKYNERYATDPNIQKVVNYLLWKIDNEQFATTPINTLDYGGSSEEDIKPTKNQIELFMRFFEELEVSIEAGRLDRDVANNLFAYYAKVLAKKVGDKSPKDVALNGYEYKEILPTDYDNKGNPWQYFKEFVKQIDIDRYSMIAMTES